MKFGARQPTRFESGPNMTPLVDVVMVILIFLMLVGTFATAERFIQQNAGTFSVGTSSSAPPPPDFVPDDPIVVRVSAGTAGDGFVARADNVTVNTAEALGAALRQRHAQLTALGKPIDKIAVVIQPDNGVRHGQYLRVYEAALQAGFTKVSFAVAS